MSGAVRKHLANDPADVVEEMIQGIVVCFPSIARLEGHHVLVRRDFEANVKNANKVAIISGGGSGHEPAHAGYIGLGMLTAAVVGGIFSSPSVDPILAAIRTVTGPAGCLLIVKNYTGDRLNFGLAAEKAKALGLRVEVVFVGDDCALEPNKGVTGRRGLTGTVFVHKVAGSVAENGGTLEQVRDAATEVSNRVGTMGVALSVCHVIGSKQSAGAKQRLHPDDGCMELGLGIHGEPGAKTAPLERVDAVMAQLAAAICQPHPLSSHVYLPLQPQQSVVLLLNNLGATTGMEMFVAARAARQVFMSPPYNVSVTRVYCGSFVTALQMEGLSLTVLDLSVDPVKKAATMDALDAVCGAPAWPQVVGEIDVNVAQVPACSSVTEDLPIEAGTQLRDASTSDSAERLKKALHAGAQALIAHEQQLTEWDTQVGDGDCGVTFERGAKAVISALDALEEAKSSPTLGSPRRLLAQLETCVAQMGGTSGAVLHILFAACEATFVELESNDSEARIITTATRAHWSAALSAGVQAVSAYGGAKPGMRTMLDPLNEFSHALADSAVDLAEVVSRTTAAAESTATMDASAGRSNYVPSEKLAGCPDPGAMAVAFAVAAALPLL